MDLGLRDRVVVITGASKGIGRQTALRFAREGAHVVLNARGSEALESVTNEVQAHGVRALPVVADVAQADGASVLAARAFEAFDHVDVLVNNVGGAGAAVKLVNLTPDDWYEGFEQNFFSAVRTASAFLPGMLERGWGRLVHLSSTNGIEPGPYFGPYSAAKAALLNYSKNLAGTYAAQGVLSNCVVPGITFTERVAGHAASAAVAQDSTTEAVMEKMLAKNPIPIGRLGEPDEVAAAVVFLASEAASWITGATLAVDGGTLRSV